MPLHNKSSHPKDVHYYLIQKIPKKVLLVMLEELVFRNVYSFKNEVSLSLEATGDKIGEGSYVVTMPDGKRLLRFALIYGANASGKSNVLKALNFLKEFMFGKAGSIDEGTGVVPFRLDAVSADKPSYFGVWFYAAGKRYHYELELNATEVVREKLSVYTSHQPTMLFDRTSSNGTSAIKYNPSVVKLSATVREELALRCYRNMSFFAARGQVNVSIPLIDEAREWFRLSLASMIGPDDKVFGYAQEALDGSEETKKELLEFIKHADFNVVDLQKQTNVTNFVHKVTNENGEEYYVLPSGLQSRGTQRILGLESAIYNANEKSSVLPIDEIDSSLHPDLIEYFLYEFLRNENQSQIIATTHYDSLLDTIDDLLRKDSIWFTEKHADGGTELFSLVEYKGLNKIASFRKSYRGGRFGAVPNM